MKPLTEEEKQLNREKKRQYMQEWRSKQKSKESSTPKAIKETDTKKKTKKLKNQRSATYSTREQMQKDALRRESNRLRQQKRRANMSSQKKRRVNEKRREQYHAKRVQTSETNRPRAKISLNYLLGKVANGLKNARSKLSLFKCAFAKKILARQDTATCHVDSSYRRPPRIDFSVEHFLDKMAIDYPRTKGSSVPKKILTKSLDELHREYKKAHPNIKISLTTFKRRRPRNIVLSGSRKFQQCLCEKCENVMLLTKTINPFLKKKTGEIHDNDLLLKVASPEDIIKRTLCTNSNRECWERACENCGVDDFMTAVKLHIGRRSLSETRKWAKWEKTEKSSKDLVFKENTLREIIEMLKEGLVSLSKHLKTAEWQREQNQFLRDHLPRTHAMITLDFAENYLCKFQNEVQSAHWSYRQVTIHPCVVFFYRCHEQDCYKTVTEYMVFLSDDLSHDSDFAKYILKSCIDYLKSIGMSTLHFFSDGAGSQYKSRFTFHDLSELQDQYRELTLTRHFFGSSHGKSQCDS